MKNDRFILIAVVLVFLVASVGIDDGTQAAEVGAGVTVEASGGPNSQYVAVNDAGKISIDLSEANQDVAGAGVNDNAVVRFDDVFSISNTNGQRAFVYLSDETDAIEFVESGQGVERTDSSIEGRDDGTVLGGGEQLTVGFAVDTNQIDDIETTFTLVVRVTKSTEELPTTTPTEPSTPTTTPTPMEPPTTTPTPMEPPTTTQTEPQTPTTTPTEPQTPTGTPTETDELDSIIGLVIAIVVIVAAAVAALLYRRRVSGSE